MNDQTVKKLALIIAANCTRESELHESLKQGKLSQEQLNSFNQQMSNKLYTFLTYLLNKPADEYSVMMEALAKHFPDNWETPELDQSFLNHSSQNQLPNPARPH
ncbi:hypothetical protein [Endozoicomonas euniceicola]|uniref:Uncharacterized protein n=1 Tax=Endozoicomonas euniceicola TaxID=1234143 RepID=A0ABY6GXP3_9GAMM|nr:hypothetical protein [Endozoicomonas euniceicola]UYM17547.1 hypothetical protein NX720_06420 [Endozoicomonas euniceicola]